jgi:hypothetical protein
MINESTTQRPVHPYKPLPRRATVEVVRRQQIRKQINECEQMVNGLNSLFSQLLCDF